MVRNLSFGDVGIGLGLVAVVVIFFLLLAKWANKSVPKGAKKK